MSKLESLIAKLCHDSVDHKTVQSVCEVVSAPKKLTKKNYNSEGLYPIIDQGQSFIAAYTNDEGALVNIGEYVVFGEHTRELKFVDFTFAQGADGLKILKAKENIMPRFLYHSLRNLEIPSRGYNRHWIILKEMLIGIPPLEVQAEIVQILDRFSASTIELIELLSTELIKRKQQYAYYRDKLLSFGDEVEWKTLGEIATDIYRGFGIKKDQVTSDGIPCVRYGEIYTKYNIYFDKCFSHTTVEAVQNPKFFENGDILFAITGESVEEIAKSTAYIGHEKCMAGGDTVVLKHEQNAKYLSYVLSTDFAKQQKSKGRIKSKVVHSNVPALKEIKIPVPPLEKQNEIVAILDRFDSLCHDLSSGIPAEIEARKKQYKYYSNKLLTFKQKENF